MFTLNAKLIPALNRNGIKFRYIDGIYDPMTIIVTHKNLDICRVDVNRDSNEPYNYDVYWFNIVDFVSCRKDKYALSENLIGDIKIAIGRLENTGLNGGLHLLVGRQNGKTQFMKALYYNSIRFDIKDVIFNNPATIVLWADGTKTVVKAENEEFDPEKGLAMAIAKKALGNNYDYYDVFKKYVGKYEKKQKKGIAMAIAKKHIDRYEKKQKRANNGK